MRNSASLNTDASANAKGIPTYKKETDFKKRKVFFYFFKIGNVDNVYLSASRASERTNFEDSVMYNAHMKKFQSVVCLD